MSEHVKCIKIYRNSNKIKGYRMTFVDTGYIHDYTPQEVKQNIREGNWTVVNLTLTSDNRLIEKKVNTTMVNKLSSKASEEGKRIIAKAKLMGKAKVHTSLCIHEFYSVVLPDKCIVYIPDNVESIGNLGGFPVINEVKDTLQIIGGRGLRTAKNLFEGCNIPHLDLSLFDTSNIQEMEGMFRNFTTTRLDLSTFNTHKVITMKWMFTNCKTYYLNVSGWDVTNVTDMSSIFERCTTPKVDISTWVTSSIEHIMYMFHKCTAKIIKFGMGFDTGVATDYGHMFSCIKVKSLDLSMFRTDKVLDMRYMFRNSRIEYLNISSFDTNNVQDMTCMFADFYTENLILTNFKTKKLVFAQGMFERCTAKRIILNSFDIANIQQVFNMFAECQTELLDISSFFIPYELATGYMFRYAQIEEIVIGDESGDVEGTLKNSSSIDAYGTKVTIVKQRKPK